MNKSRFTEEKMVAILQEADRLQSHAPKLGIIDAELTATNLSGRPEEFKAYIQYDLSSRFDPLNE